MLFYDKEGCRLFYKITELPEYYLTRTEMALLPSLPADILPPGMQDGILVEFGGSDETKAGFLLDRPGRPFSTYMPIDVAAESLEAMRVRMARTHRWLNVLPVVGDFMQPLRLPDMAGRPMGFFPGSTIGNLDPATAAGFLRTARQSLGADARFLLGADLRKSPKVLLTAYNDAAVVTAAFNQNLLRRLNREAVANFDLAAFRHEAMWNDAESRIEMHLISTREQDVRLANTAIRFREGESIHTENSYKHRQGTLIQIARDAGWNILKVFQDQAGLFAEFLLEA
jgi:dimethylhistidine N-methyltransferase